VAKIDAITAFQQSTYIRTVLIPLDKFDVKPELIDSAARSHLTKPFNGPGTSCYPVRLPQVAYAFLRAFNCIYAQVSLCTIHGSSRFGIASAPVGSACAIRTEGWAFRPEFEGDARAP